MNLNNISKLEIMSIKTFLIMVLMGFAGMNIQAQEKFSSEELDTMIVELKKIFHQQQMYEKSIDLQFPLKKCQTCLGKKVGCGIFSDISTKWIFGLIMISIALMCKWMEWCPNCRIFGMKKKF